LYEGAHVLERNDIRRSASSKVRYVSHIRVNVDFPHAIVRTLVFAWIEAFVSVPPRVVNRQLYIAAVGNCHSACNIDP
jgi:hypothetical protein